MIKTGRGLFEVLQNGLKSLDLDLDNVRGLGYDIWANMTQKHPKTPKHPHSVLRKSCIFVPPPGSLSSNPRNRQYHHHNHHHCLSFSPCTISFLSIQFLPFPSPSLYIPSRPFCLSPNLSKAHLKLMGWLTQLLKIYVKNNNNWVEVGELVRYVENEAPR